jgi:hypothetical protein
MPGIEAGGPSQKEMGIKPELTYEEVLAEGRKTALDELEARITLDTQIKAAIESGDYDTASELTKPLGNTDSIATCVRIMKDADGKTGDYGYRNPFRGR